MADRNTQAERDLLLKALTEISELYSGGHAYRATAIAKAAIAAVSSPQETASE